MPRSKTGEARRLRVRWRRTPRVAQRSFATAHMRLTAIYDALRDMTNGGVGLVFSSTRVSASRRRRRSSAYKKFKTATVLW